jgi:hypothetical protein
MANQYLPEMAPDDQVLVDMRPTNRAMNFTLPSTICSLLAGGVTGNGQSFSKTERVASERTNCRPGAGSFLMIWRHSSITTTL